MIQRFFLFCAGVDTSLTRGPDFSTERSKYAAAGTFVFLTAVFAAVFAGFALSDLTPNPLVYGPAAALWATFIFCLDRQIVMSIRKTDSWTKQFIVALPRLAIAFFIGMIISRPFELWIFQPEIKLILNKNEDERLRSESTKQENQRKAVNDRFQEEIERINTQTETLMKERQRLQSEVNDVSNQLVVNRSNVTLDTGTRWNNTRTLQMQRDLLKRQNNPQVADISTQIKAGRDRTRILFAQIKPQAAPETSLSMTRREKFGLLDRLEALDQFGRENKAGGAALLFLSSLFVLIEMVPVFMKLMSMSGPYDEIVAVRNKEASQRYKEELDALHRTSENRVQQLVEQEHLLLREKSQQLGKTMGSAEMDELLEKSRLGIAKIFAERIARSLSNAAQSLSSSETKLSSAYQREFEEEFRRISAKMAEERGYGEVQKGTLSGITMVVLNRMKLIFRDFKARMKDQTS